MQTTIDLHCLYPCWILACHPAALSRLPAADQVDMFPGLFTQASLEGFSPVVGCRQPANGGEMDTDRDVLYPRAAAAWSPRRSKYSAVGISDAAHFASRSVIDPVLAEARIAAVVALTRASLRGRLCRTRTVVLCVRDPPLALRATAQFLFSDSSP